MDMEYKALRSTEVVPACSPSPSTSSGMASTTSALPNCILHKVAKTDTLAGLAIKYNVSVADIKRANGLLSDSALFARDVVQIPTGAVPLGEQLQVMIAQVATGFGRDPVLNAEAHLHPASAAAARVARTLNIINGSSYPPDDDTNLPWWCRCGTCDFDDANASCRHSRRNSDSDPGEYEMMERTADAGPTRMHGRMRRRKGHMADGEDDVHSDEGEGSAPTQQRWHGRAPTQPPVQSSGTGQQGDGFSNLFKGLSQFGKSLGEKLKAAANQPALATAQQHGLGDAADAVLLGRRQAGPSQASGGMMLQQRPRYASSDGGAGQQQRVSKTGGKDD